MIVPSDIPAALAELGITGEIRGTELKARCPSGNHPDWKPSWSINTESGLFNCFSCQFSGDLIRLVQFMRGLSYDDALAWIIRLPIRIHEHAPLTPEPAGLSLSRFVPPPAEQLADRYLSDWAAAEYELLWDAPESAWIAAMRVPVSLELMGWQKKSPGKKFLNFPKGAVKSSTLFGIQFLRQFGSVIVVESPLDAVRLASLRLDYIPVASFGAELSGGQVYWLQQVRHLILALDNDRAGLAATRKAVPELSCIPDLRIFNYGESPAKDPGEMKADDITWGIGNSLHYLEWDGT